MAKLIAKIRPVVYIIKNDINELVYVGQTVRSIQTRFNEHVRAALAGKSNSKFYNAIRYHGETHFWIEELEVTPFLDAREMHYINLYDSFNHGYNSTIGGHGKHGGEIFFPVEPEDIETLQGEYIFLYYDNKNKDNTIRFLNRKVESLCSALAETKQAVRNRDKTIEKLKKENACLKTSFVNLITLIKVNGLGKQLGIY